MHPQPRMQNKKAYEHSHHRFTGITRHSPRNGVTTYNVISPVIGLCCHRRRRDTSRRLERQRRGVRTTRLRRPRNARLVERAFASIASRPAFVTIASRPSLGRDQIALLLFLAERQAIFRIFRNPPVPIWPWDRAKRRPAPGDTPTRHLVRSAREVPPSPRVGGIKTRDADAACAMTSQTIHKPTPPRSRCALCFRLLLGDELSSLLSYPSHFCGVEPSEDGERELPAKAKPLT
jgi:hypothetical protein